MPRPVVHAAVVAAAAAILAVGFVTRSEAPRPLPTPKPAAAQAASGWAPGPIAMQRAPEPPLDAFDVEPKWRRVEEYPTESASSWHWGTWVLREPDDFPDVPAAIRTALSERWCRIPQDRQTTVRHNLLWGEFDRKGQRDLVVLCAEPGRTIVYIFWAGDADQRVVAPFGGGPDGRMLTIATAADVDAHAHPRARVSADMPQALDHDVIEDGCCECCSVYYYRHRGRWFSAPGAD